MSILAALRMGADALMAQQQALQTAGHNISNVNTSGYTRQRVTFSSGYPGKLGGPFLGLGVNVSAVTGMVNNFLESQLVELQSGLGSTDAQQQALSAVANAFPITEKQGIGPALNAFWGALSDLSNNPAGAIERQNVIGKAGALGSVLGQTRDALVDVQSNLDKDLDAAVRRVNVLLPQIASLNRKITEGEAGGHRANDFRDQRQQLLQELSKLTGATVEEGSDGQVVAQVDGIVLVSGVYAASLDNSSVNASGFRNVTYVSPEGAAFDATALLTKGQVGGLLAARDTTVVSFLGQLDLFAKTLVDVVNTQHALGFDLNGVAGGNFFAPLASTAGAARLVRVDSAIVADPRLIATAQSATSVPGDNRNANALANLQNVVQAPLGNLTLKDYFSSFISNVGQQLQSAQDASKFQQALVDQVQQRRDSLSGVNIDEEVTNMIQFQRAFQAASRIISTSDEMYQALINMAP
jgi:flagellar hook-associated protein 1 FlgK